MELQYESLCDKVKIKKYEDIIWKMYLLYDRLEIR